MFRLHHLEFKLCTALERIGMKLYCYAIGFYTSFEQTTVFILSKRVRLRKTFASLLYKIVSKGFEPSARYQEYTIYSACPTAIWFSLKLIIG